MLSKYTLLFFALCLACIGQHAFAQRVITPPNPQDSVRVIEIRKSDRLYQKTGDTTNMEMAAGNVVIIEGLTTTYCDSAVFNHRTNIIEAFGNVHINDHDSIHTYAQYLRYVGAERLAYLRKNVKLTDNKGFLLTDELVYDLRTGIATYNKSGKIINGNTVLTSQEAVYHADTKDVYFKKNVHLVDPDRNIWTDSLLYNINTNMATFIAPTHIVNKDGSVIDTKAGTYNLKTGEAIFTDRTSFKDSTRSGIADKVAYDKNTGTIQMEGRARLVDSVNKATVLGDQIFIDTKANSFLATRKPVMILYRDGDSTYVAADTLFSGIRKYDSTERKNMLRADTLKKTVALKATADTAVRYFLGFHHVRIFNDSLQAVSDSLHYSAADSTFKLFGSPVVWNAKSQVKGDTIYMYTKNQKPERLYVFYNAIIINKNNDAMYNQIAGRTLNGYFKDGAIDYVRVKGSPAESIFYPQDEDSAFVGMNRSSGDVIDIYFANKELNKVKFINNVDGVTYPIRQIPADKKQLKNFMWLDNRRPKNKLELFE